MHAKKGIVNILAKKIINERINLLKMVPNTHLRFSNLNGIVLLKNFCLNKKYILISYTLV